MTESDFTERFLADIPMLKAWGDMVTNVITQTLERDLGNRFRGFFKIAPIPRVKDIDSALHKAFIVKAGKYTNPYEEMEDRVGVRFVVLLGHQVDKIARLIESQPISLWTRSRDVDFETRRSTDPYIFDKYQSVHYVVRAAAGLMYSEVSIASGTPCEIQIRTLLQHAHSELTHDTIYKPGATDWQREKKAVERLVARGMALVETTDAVFEDVMSEILNESEPIDNWTDDLAALYQSQVGRNYDRKASTNHLIINSYLQARPTLTFDEVRKFFLAEENKGHVERIRDHASNAYLYRLPAVLLAYYIAKVYPHLSKDHWPLTDRSLEDIYTDVGRSLT